MQIGDASCYPFVIRNIYLLDSEPFNNIIRVISRRRQVAALFKMLILHAFWTV